MDNVQNCISHFVSMEATNTGWPRLITGQSTDVTQVDTAARSVPAGLPTLSGSNLAECLVTVTISSLANHSLTPSPPSRANGEVWDDRAS
jgi:hypothetical protein